MEEEGSEWEQACFEQCRSVPSRSPSNIYRMQLCTLGCNPSLLLKHLVQPMMAKYDGGGSRTVRALFGKKMPAAANIVSVAVNGDGDGLRSQWREGINSKHRKRGLFSANDLWPSSSWSFLAPH